MRRPDWQPALAGVVEAWRFRTFTYGVVDCFQFAGAAVLAETGVDYRDRFPRYGSQLEAARILRRVGGPIGLLDSVLGSSRHVAYAQPGDVVVGEFGHGLTAGICLGVNCCSPGERGLVFRRTAVAAASWEI